MKKYGEKEEQIRGLKERFDQIEQRDIVQNEYKAKKQAMKSIDQRLIEVKD